MSAPRDILITIALPYANGPLHLGHMLEAIQADIWARFQRLRGNHCLYLCGSDAHGTPVMLSAEKQGLSPENWSQQVHEEHANNFNQFNISFDNFYTTDSPENKTLVTEFYRALEQNGDITQRVITQAYDEEKQIFLADRFVVGECPRCHAAEQYGDSCEACGATYQPNELINPVSALSQTTPIEKESEHFFVVLEHYRDFLLEWLDQPQLQTAMTNKLKEWFNEPLRDWDISRDAPYFGFTLPDHDDKYFYVWLDAPIGYLASLKNLAERDSSVDFDHYWNTNSSAEVHHFIGKDIAYFHMLFWPAILKAANYRIPSNVLAHGFLTINGQKMSKSRGTFITADEYLAQLPPDYIRYYFAAKLNTGVDDIDLNFDDFRQRVNADCVGKYVNLASRCAGFINKKFSGQLASEIHEPALYQAFVDASEEIAECYEHLNYNQAIRHIMALADKANQYIDHHKPWALAKQEEELPRVQLICTQGLNLFRLLTIFLKPILPNVVEEAETFLNVEPLQWQDLFRPQLSASINAFKPLMQRITEEQLEPLLKHHADITS